VSGACPDDRVAPEVERWVAYRWGLALLGEVVDVSEFVWSEEQVVRVTIRGAARHGTCRKGHQHPVFRPRYRREPWQPEVHDL
jgi:hypothetical protein